MHTWMHQLKEELAEGSGWTAVCWTELAVLKGARWDSDAYLDASTREGAS